MAGIAPHLLRDTGRWLAVVVLALAALPAAAVATTDDGPHVTVMTRNLFLGSGLSNLVGVDGPAELATAVGEDWADVLASDFRTRATALADEIARADPDVVGLQEVTLWRDAPTSDLREHPGPNATHVVYDHLTLLTAALTARGSPYSVVASATTDDFEVIRRDGSALTDLRITDRDVLLVRADRLDDVVGARTGHYEAVRVLPSWPAPVESPRGWATVDLRLDDHTTVRVLDTHLEVSNQGAGGIQQRQADELLAMVEASPYPVIALGDFNSDPADPWTDTYQRLTARLTDAWTTARPDDPGFTCCQPGPLDDAPSRVNRRVDLVLTSEDWPVSRVALTGATPFRSDPPPLWASDHAGVSVRISILG